MNNYNNSRAMRILALSMIALLSIVRPSYGFLEHEYREGEITVIEASGAQDQGVPVLKIGNMVEFTIPVFASTFFGEYVIKANGTLVNNSDDAVRAIYYISFFDEESKMIGCSHGMWEFKGKGRFNYGSALITSTPQLAKRVVKYKLRIIVDEPLP